MGYFVNVAEGLLRAPLQIALLGPPQILLKGVSLVPLLSRRAQALLYFLTSKKQFHQRSHLAALFWPDVAEAQARKNLRNILPELREHLAPYFYIDREMIGVCNQQEIALDTHLIVKLLQDEEVKNNPTRLLESASLYRGEFMDGFAIANAPFYEEWIASQRAQYHHFLVDALYRSVQLLLSSGDTTSGIQVARKLLEIDRWHEATHRLVMHFLWLDGQQAAALNHYRKLQLLLRDEFATEPDAMTQRLWEKIRSSPNSSFSPLGTHQKSSAARSLSVM